MLSYPGQSKSMGNFCACSSTVPRSSVATLMHAHRRKSEVYNLSNMKRRFFLSQALQGDLAVKEDTLDKGVQTHQHLQAETDRLRKAYEQERDTAQLLQQDKSTLILKIKAKEQVHCYARFDCIVMSFTSRTSTKVKMRAILVSRASEVDIAAGARSRPA